MTPAELVNNALLFDGAQVYIVGRVMRSRTISDEAVGDESYLASDELELAPEDGVGVLIGSSGVGGVSRGDIIYALGRVAAVGQARSSEGGIRETAYFLAMNLSTGVDYDTGIAGFDEPGSARLRAALEAETRRGG